MRISAKQNIQLPQITNPHQLQLQKQKDVVKPKLQKIIYSPVFITARKMTNATLLQALVSKKSYQDVKDQMKERQIQQCLRQTKQILFDRDQKYKNRIGKQAPLKYYESYKKLDKLMCKKKMIGQSAVLAPIQQDPVTLVLEATQNQKILPCCIGFVKTEGDASIINLKGQKFGDKYIKAISAGLKQSKMIESCVFSNNRLTDIGLNQILKNINHDIIKLDLSHNRIAKIDQKLIKFLVQPQARLEYLNLQNNLLPDKGVDSLCKVAACSKRLRYFNLRKNLLTKNCAQGIAQLIERSTCLQQLYIGMNRISEEGAIKILEQLQQNKIIKIFDYCMNKLGQTSISCAKAVSNVISANKTLIHVDFSGNNFNQQQSKIIAEKLQKNKKIYGFHFSGNYGYVDSKGFLRLQNSDITSLHSIVNRNINSYDINFRRQGVYLEPTRYTNVCWICQGWYEQTFRFIVPQPRQDGKNLVYIHFDFQEFEPRLINITQIKVKYKTMVPPRKYRYFFTWNNSQYPDCNLGGTNKSIQTDKNSNHHEPNQIVMQFPLSYTYNINNQEISFKVDKVSSRTGKPKKIVNSWDQIIISVLPRQQDLISKKQKKVWSYKDSLWAKQWKLQDEQLTKNCFEKDWKSSKITNLVKNQIEQQKIKQILYKSYKLIKQLYRYYASWSPVNTDIWAVTSTTFTQFCHLAKIVSKQTPLTIIDLTFITTNSLSNNQYRGNILVPQRGLVRFRFMQAIVRLSQQKFKKNGLADSILESVKSMIKDHIQPFSDNPICNNEKWRLQKYFCQQNDMLIKKYRPIFTQLYKKNSKMKVKPGNKPFMCLTQFKSIIQRIGLAGDQVLQRDIYLSFNCSMMTQIDQLENQRFIRMTQIEFIQAIARCAYILPDRYKVEDYTEVPTPFFAKFQWIIHQLKNLCSEQIKNMFFGTASIFNQQDDDD